MGMIVYNFNPNDLPDEYLRATGLVVTSASQTEKIMRDFAGALLGIDNIESIAFGTHLSFPMKDNIIRAVVELNAPSASAVDTLDDILDEIENALLFRNVVAHSEFAIHPDNGDVYLMREKARGSLQVDFKPVKTEELLAAAERIYQAGLALQDYMTRSGLIPRLREGVLREPLNRKKKAREQRRTQYGEIY